MDWLIDFLSGKLDKDKQYYTDDEFSKELGLFAIYVLEQERLLTKEKFETYKKEFMEIRNKAFIEAITKQSGNTEHGND
jgi:transposase-like protein